MNETKKLDSPEPDLISIYCFEENGRRQFPDKNSEDAALKEFKDRLEIKGIADDDHRDVLLNFILNYHKVISRYEELRTKEIRWRGVFTGLSLFLLFAIPFLIFKISNNDGVVPQLTAVLTGILAVHKSFSSWLDKRIVVGNFWKAESDLKTKLYSFEDKWKGKSTEALSEKEPDKFKLKIDFLKEASAAIAEARAIVQDEQTKFFAAVTYPSIDIGQMLKDSGETAKGLVSAHASPELEQQNKRSLEIETLKSKVVQLKKEVEDWKRIVEEKRQQLLTTPAEPKETADAIKLAITSQEAKRLQAEGDLVIAEGQLAALQSNAVRRSS
jgi:hypothetical protein